MAKKRRKKQNKKQSAPPQPRPRLEGEDRLRAAAVPVSSDAPREHAQSSARKRRKKRRGLLGRLFGRLFGGRKKEQKRRSRGARLRAIAERKRRAERRFKLEAVLVYLICGTMAAASFFPIARVETRGLTHYPEAEVLETFGVEPGDNMFFTTSFFGAKRLEKQYPYFEDVRVTRELPDKMIVNVTETDTVAAVGAADGGYYLVDENCRVLEHVTASGETPRVTGMNVSETVIGRTLSNEQDGRVESLKTLLTALKDAGMLEYITAYCMVDITDIYICYDGRVAVHLGTLDQLEQKLHDMEELLANNLSPSDIKKLDLTGLPIIRLIPSDQDEVDRIMRGEFSRAQEIGETDE